MEYARSYEPQVRECDDDIAVGARGYLYYFQDVASSYMRLLDRGNDVLPERYGKFWVYAKYRLRIFEKARLKPDLAMRCWLSHCDRARVWQDMEIRAGERLLAAGRVECCVYDLKERKLCRIDDVDMPKGLEGEPQPDVAAFRRFRRSIGEMTETHRHVVRYTELDNGGHMNNLHYGEMFLNAFPPEFYRENRVAGIEIHYLNQTYYGEELTVYRKDLPGGVLLAAVKQTGVTAAECMLDTEPRR